MLVQTAVYPGSCFVCSTAHKLVKFVLSHCQADCIDCGNGQLRIASHCFYGASGTEGTELTYCDAKLSAVRAVLGY